MGLILKRVLHECMFTWGNYIKMTQKSKDNYECWLQSTEIIKSLIFLFVLNRPRPVVKSGCHSLLNGHGYELHCFSLSVLSVSSLNTVAPWLVSGQESCSDAFILNPEMRLRVWNSIIAPPIFLSFFIKHYTPTLIAF